MTKNELLTSAEIYNCTQPKGEVRTKLNKAEKSVFDGAEFKYEANGKEWT